MTEPMRWEHLRVMGEVKRRRQPNGEGKEVSMDCEHACAERDWVIATALVNFVELLSKAKRLASSHHEEGTPEVSNCDSVRMLWRC